MSELTNNAEALKIAVASDLHAYDEKDNASDPSPSHFCITESENEPGKHPITGLTRLIDEENLTADLLLCPGDLGDKARPSAIQYAWKSIHQVGEKLRVSLVAATSGNHDLDSRFKYNSYDAKGLLQGLEPPYPLPDEVLNDKYWARNFVIIERNQYRLVILNSSAYHGTVQEEIKHGRVSDSTLAALEKELKKSGDRSINILLCHHHPQQHSEIQLGEYDVIANGQQLLDLIGSGNYGRWLVVHGHKHHPKITYAKGSATSAVVFSAGSLCASLYPELQTRARNQFYLISLPYEDIEAFGMVGTIRAWDWASGAGWEPSAGMNSGLASLCAFGCRSDPRPLARKIAQLVVEEKVAWEIIRASLPEVDYLTPQDALTLRTELKDRHRLIIMEVDGRPREIGKSLS